MLIHKGCGGGVEEDRSLKPYRYDSNEDGNEIEIYPYVCQKCSKEILGDAELEIVVPKLHMRHELRLIIDATDYPFVRVTKPLSGEGFDIHFWTYYDYQPEDLEVI